MPEISDSTPRAYFIFHGHFYQPPRENPWTDEVELERSARPFHDWNARISSECYRPNAFVRISDHQGRIEEILNGYEQISFNFGPTLLRWMQKHDRLTLDRIAQADVISIRRHGGHGNAIAQAYNHMILPLASERDRRTQILWGLEDFRQRFKREAEALWLPECAASNDVLDDLIDHGLRYTILAPQQARRVRPSRGAQWIDVSGGKVDPSRPYLYRHSRNPEHTLALFFYDGPLASKISFGGALGQSQSLLDAIEAAYDPQRKHPQLVHVAVDGETAGHHVSWGDRALAYALRHEAERRGFRVTNYGEYLDLFPPEWEAEIDLGPLGEGSAWSCAHGVGRWIRDCSCHIGGDEGWNQAWRTPLREALDLLRDSAAVFYEKEASAFLKDPWSARDDYIQLLLNTDPQTRSEFFLKHSSGELKEEQQQRALALLEMQHQAQLMYTSCGWFFDDISGLESVQILRYAAAALDLWEELGDGAIRSEFESILEKAVSNDSTEGTGRDIFQRKACCQRVTARRVAAHMVMCGLESTPPEFGGLALHRFHRRKYRVQKREQETLITGYFSLEHQRTLRRQDLKVAMLHRGGLDFTTCVAPCHEEDCFGGIQDELHSALIVDGPAKVREIMIAQFEPSVFGAEDLLESGRQDLLEGAYRDLLYSFSRVFSQLYDKHRSDFDALYRMGLELPQELKVVAEFTLRGKFEREFLNHAGSADPLSHQHAISVVRQAYAQNLSIDTSLAQRHLSWMIEEMIQYFIQSESGQWHERKSTIKEVLELSSMLKIRLELDRSQEVFFAHLSEMIEEAGSQIASLRKVAELLGFSPMVFEGQVLQSDIPIEEVGPRGLS